MSTPAPWHDQASRATPSQGPSYYLLHARAAAQRARAHQPISTSVATEVARLFAVVDQRLRQHDDVVAAAA